MQVSGGRVVITKKALGFANEDRPRCAEALARRSRRLPAACPCAADAASILSRSIRHHGLAYCTMTRRATQHGRCALMPFLTPSGPPTFDSLGHRDAQLTPLRLAPRANISTPLIFSIWLSHQQLCILFIATYADVSRLSTLRSAMVKINATRVETIMWRWLLRH